jgi:hypothetical protein
MYWKEIAVISLEWTFPRKSKIVKQPRKSKIVKQPIKPSKMDPDVDFKGIFTCDCVQDTDIPSFPLKVANGTCQISDAFSLQSGQGLRIQPQTSLNHSLASEWTASVVNCPEVAQTVPSNVINI